MARNSPAPSDWNLWPVAIISFFAIAICCCVAFVVFCNQHPTELVARDYYDQEMRYQQQMERVSRALEMGTKVAVVYDPDNKVLRLSLPSEHAQGGYTGTVHLYRPSAAQLDRSLPLSLNAEGTQAIDVSALRPGLWKVKVHWTADGKQYYTDKTLNL